MRWILWEFVSKGFIKPDSGWHCSSPGTAFPLSPPEGRLNPELVLNTAGGGGTVAMSPQLWVWPRAPPAELPLSNGSLSPINSSWARSPLPEWAFLLSCVPVLPAQVTAAPSALLHTPQIFKSPSFCREKMPITRGSHVNSADDRNHLLFVTLFACIWWFIGKGLSLCTHQDMASLVFLGWMLFCSHLNNHLFFLSSRALYGRTGAREGRGTAAQETQGYQSSCSAEVCMGAVG